MQSQKVASQSHEIEDLRTQITKWKAAAKGVNKESKGRRREMALMAAKLTAAAKEREEILYALEQAQERNTLLESSLSSSQQRFNDQV